MEILNSNSLDLRILRHQYSNYDRIKDNIKTFISNHVTNKTCSLKVYNYCKNYVNNKLLDVVQQERIKQQQRIDYLESLLNIKE